MMHFKDTETQFKVSLISFDRRGTKPKFFVPVNVLTGTAARLSEVLGEITVMLYWLECRMASSLRCDPCIEKKSEKLSDVNLLSLICYFTTRAASDITTDSAEHPSAWPHIQHLPSMMHVRFLPTHPSVTSSPLSSCP